MKKEVSTSDVVGVYVIMPLIVGGTGVFLLFVSTNDHSAFWRFVFFSFGLFFVGLVTTLWLPVLSLFIYHILVGLAEPVLEAAKKSAEFMKASLEGKE